MTFVVAAAVLALPVLSSAQDWTPMGPHQGAVTGNANGSFTDIGAGEITTLSIQMTYFMTDVIEVGGGISFFDATGVPSTTAWFALANYYLPFGTDTKMRVYVGARFFDFDNGTDGFAGALGMHYFLRPNVSITPELQLGEIDGSSYTQLAFGLTIWFK
ncbi:MAG: hypothetical protein ABIV13_00790 [Fimbriimonadales bacterium]